MTDQSWCSRQVHTWHLEQLSPFSTPVREPPAYQLSQLTDLQPEFCRYLYAGVGGPWHWYERLPWSRAQWLTCLADPARKTWVAYLAGEPAGYFELMDHGARNIEIAYFGLFPHRIGQGLGKPLLFDAIDAAQRLGAHRLWLHTCDMDHPAALANYQQCGFHVFHEETFEARIPNPMPVVPPAP